MKLTRLISAIFLSAILLTSCSGDEVFSPIEQKSEVTNGTTLKSNTTFKIESASSQVSTTTPKAYIFVEPISKSNMVATYLNTVTQSSSSNRRFLGFFVGPGVAVQHNLLYYIDMPHWYDGRLPSVIQADIPQVSGGFDDEGNPKTAYNFTTVKISKNTVSGFGWVNILIPVSAMSNDTKRQKSIATYEKVGNRLITNGTVKGRVYNMNSVMYSYTFNYQGNRIPKGVYRLYTTYPDPGMRANLNTTNDYYLRGNSN